jgi:hypothetical protein
MDHEPKQGRSSSYTWRMKHKNINSKYESTTPDKIVLNPLFLAQPLGLNLTKKQKKRERNY